MFVLFFVYVIMSYIIVVMLYFSCMILFMCMHFTYTYVYILHIYVLYVGVHVSLYVSSLVISNNIIAIERMCYVHVIHDGDVPDVDV